jgi:hypothetical protein
MRGSVFERFHEFPPGAYLAEIEVRVFIDNHVVFNGASPVKTAPLRIGVPAAQVRVLRRERLLRRVVGRFDRRPSEGKSLAFGSAARIRNP